MKYWPTNHNKKKYSKKLSVEYKKPTSHSEKSDNEQKSKNYNMDKENSNLFKGIIKVTKKSLKEKKTPETQSNTINNNIFDFTNFVYNNEEHLNNDKFYIIKSSKNNNSPKYNNAISPSSILESKNKIFNKSKSSLEISNLSNHVSKEQNINIKTTLFNKNSKKLSLNYNNNNTVRKKQKRGSVIGNMTHKNRNNHNFHFFFKLKEKDKIPSKTPYLDKIWNFSNNKLDSKPKTNIHTKKISEISLVKQNSYEINTNKISKTNIKYEKNEEILDKSENKLEKDKNKETIDKKQEEKIEKNETKNSDKIIFSAEKIKKNNIIFNLLNKPFFCCFK